jgi:dUTP pyrophosphatase
MLIQYVKRHPDAVTPSRANRTDIGLDLVAIAKHKVYPNGATLYDTGIAVSPPPGYYIELVPRSSISKTGWVLANSVGTIDPSYTGNLFVALIRVDPEAPEISLPFCACQIALRKAEYADVKEVEELTATERGDGGFGSTGERTC